MKHELPSLGYDYNALEPYIDETTMKIHHTKHHQGYTNKFNTALENNPELQEKTAEEIITDLNNIPENIRTAVRNNGGGYINHKFFWKILKKDTGFRGEIAQAITEWFGSYDAFKEEFSKSASTLFGSGWTWLVWNGEKLEITQTKNQDSPLTEGKIPLLNIDVCS